MRFVIMSVLGLIAAALFLAARPQEPRAGKMANKYSDWPVAYIGKHFDLSQDKALAWQRDDGGFVLAMVAEDFVSFESATERVTVPFTMLRLVVRK